MSKRIDPSCSKCREKWSKAYSMSGYSPSLLKWHNVSMVRSTGDGVIFRCGNCGHEWRSYSKNAMRILRAANR